MSKQPTGAETSIPEYAVRRDTISNFFHPPLPTSTFYDLVNKGKIIPFKGIKGFYRLNDSLRRLGLREVKNLPSQTSSRSMEDIVRLAFMTIDPEIFPPSSWMLSEETIEERDKDHARLVADLHRVPLEELGTFQEKV
ncbi:MAG: hypothetical protein EON58_09125, partial [Alphaproteobacteria bacterium]